MNLKELSLHLGLSQTTVSRALNGYPEVSEATRKRVTEAAHTHGYSPNVRAKGLATGRSHAIGHVIPVSTSHEMVNPIFGDFISGAGETYSRNGFDMILSVVPDGQEEQAYRQLKAKSTVDGVILHGPRSIEPRIALLDEIDLPFLVHGRASDEASEYAWIDVNNRQAFFRATSYLLDLGHREIALINGLETMDFALRRRQGYHDAMTQAGLPPRPEFLTSEEMTEFYGHRAAREMLAMDTPPTAFLVSSIISAFGVRRAIEESGRVMGKDVSIVIHDDDLSYLRNGLDVPIFTATRSSVRHAGRLAAEMLVAMIGSPDKQCTSQLLEAELVVGQSTGPAPRPT